MWTRERISVCAYFAILGLGCSAWVSSLDDAKTLLNLTDGEMGWLLFAGPFGNLVTFFFASALVARLGTRRSVRWVATIYLAAAVALTSCFFFKAPVAVWCAVIALYGGSGNIVNISINAQAGLVEKHAGRQIMSSFHAVFSSMMFGGALFTLTTTSFNIPVALRMLVACFAAMVLHAVFAVTLPADEPAAARRDMAGRRWHRPDRALVAMGLAALVIMGCEASICDWVCIYFRESIRSTETQAKWGFCAVTGMMAFARLVGDGLVNRYTPRRMLRLDSVLVASGLALALAVPFTGLVGLSALFVSLAGYAVAGFGIAGMIPILYSRVNRTKAMPPASALTFVGSMGFFGYFFGPPIIGHVADVTNLSVGLSIFAVLILSLLLLSFDERAKNGLDQTESCVA